MSSWATFWGAIGSGEFNMQLFTDYLDMIPSDKRKVKAYMQTVVASSENWQEAEIYPILQAASFGGKQIWKNGEKWENAFFRDYWEPTETSVRRSPANPMQPSPEELHRRVNLIAKQMLGVACIRADIRTALDWNIPENSVVYVDPTYSDTTGYAFQFDIDLFAQHFMDKNESNRLFISEGKRLTSNSTQLVFGGAKGGISGNKPGKHQEWLNRYF